MGGAKHDNMQKTRRYNRRWQ